MSAQPPAVDVRSAPPAPQVPAESVSRAVEYICGECGKKTVLKVGESITCTHCGYRIVFKQRTTRAIQFDAR